MPEIPPKAGPLYRLRAKAQSVIGYSAVIARQLRAAAPNAAESELNARLVGYPRNHNYHIADGRVIPGFRLYERARLVRAVLPRPLTSFLDIACCRGFYVFDAARQPSCRVATGIDVHPPFVEIGRTVSRQIGADNAAFHEATLDRLAARPAAYGAPFQTILLIGAYHYLFWGSDYAPASYRSHREILSRLAKLCAGRVILSGRLELDRLPRGIRAAASRSPQAREYNTATFVKHAREFFTVRLAGFLGAYPLLVMDKKEGV